MVFELLERIIVAFLCHISYILAHLSVSEISFPKAFQELFVMKILTT